MSPSEKVVASLVAKMDADSLRDLAALALRGVDAVALLTETTEERTRRLDRERKKRTRAGHSAGQTADTNRTLAGHEAESERTTAGHSVVVEGVGGGLSLGISGSSLPVSDPKENTKNPPTPRRRRSAEVDAPAVELVVDAAMQAKAIERRWPDPFEAYEALKDNYLAKGKRAVGVGGWQGALRGWLKRNLDGQPVWDRTAEESRARLAAHRARAAAPEEPATETAGPEVHEALEALAARMTTPRLFEEDAA